MIELVDAKVVKLFPGTWPRNRHKSILGPCYLLSLDFLTCAVCVSFESLLF